MAALIIAVLMLCGTKVHAWDWYMMDFNSGYGTEFSVLDTCKLCHTDAPFYYPTINGFGSDFARSDLGAHTFNQALEDWDSDGDGFSNIREIRALTFPGDPASQPPPGPTLDILSINGSLTVNEGDTASYEALAFWSDGSMTTVPAAWAVSPEPFATIDASGVLTALEVASNQDVTVSATYDGTTSVRTVTIVNVPVDPPPLPAVTITLKPVDGAVNVPVTAVVVATLNGSGDIAALVNENTFSLSVAGSVKPCGMGTFVPKCVTGEIVRGTIEYNDGRTEATFTPLVKLANARAYKAAVKPGTGALQPVLAAPVTSTFHTIAKTPDSDGDGVEDGEDDHPNDKGKASPPCVRGSGKILVERFGNAGIAIAGAEGISDMHPQFKRQGKPFGFSFPDGLVRYKLKNVPHGGAVTVAVTFPGRIPKGSRIFKVGANGFRENLAAVVNGNKVTLTLRDGGEGDEDGIVNGEIEDPIGVAVPEDAGGSADLSSTVSAAGGCSVGGSGGGWSEAFGSFAIIGFVWLVFALLRRHPGNKA